MFTLAFVALVFSIQAEQTRVLWLGNSYVAVNNLPQLFHDLALSAGDTVIFDSNTPGGFTLQQHSVNATSIQKIYSQPWDFVIVQAQSQEPSFPPAQVATQTFPYAHILDSLIRDNNPCTETVFYMTWGKKYGDQQNCGGYPILCTFDGVQSRLTESYLQMANDNHALVAPAGRAWQTSWHTDTLINLWSADNSHPSLAGSYLTACVFYATIFRKSPVGVVYSPISVQSTNSYLQNMAFHTVFDSLSNWNIGNFDPVAEFSFTGNEATGVFNFNHELSQNYDTYFWDFGDGSSSTTTNTHTYTDTGTFVTTLIVSDSCGKSDTLSHTISIQQPNSVHSVLTGHISVHPNPTHSYWSVEVGNYFTEDSFIELLDIKGRMLLKLKLLSHKDKQNISIPAQNLENGVYFLRVKEAVKKLLKY